MKTVSDVFKNSLKSKHAITVKLLGDSITHGVGGDGFLQNGEHIVDGFARNPGGYCWANMFRDYMLEKYRATVINNACTGTKIEFVIEHFDELVTCEDDIVICTIGTNNRHKLFADGDKPTREEYLEEFYENILKLNALFEKAGKTVIFVANIPAAQKNEKDSDIYWRILHMNDINDAYKKAAAIHGFPFISMYDEFSKYCLDNNISVDSLLADGLHPNNNGYDVMFELMKNSLGV